MLISYLILSLSSYLLGSIPTGLLIGKLLNNIDLRQHGSKNIGATNAFRILGFKTAFIILIFDITKGILCVYLGHLIENTSIAELIGGIFSIIGHNWSIFLNFKGGRGIATGFGIIMFLIPKVTLIIFLVWIIIVLTTHYISLASIIAAILFPVCILILKEKIEFLYFGLVAAIFIIIRHYPNIKRLLKGSEFKLSQKLVKTNKE